MYSRMGEHLAAHGYLTPSMEVVATQTFLAHLARSACQIRGTRHSMNIRRTN
jgi:hypothetical protein